MGNRVLGYILTGMICMATPLVVIPTINLCNGNGFKLLISGSSKSDNNSDDKKKPTNGKEKTPQENTKGEIDEEEIDTTKSITNEELRKLYNALLSLKSGDGGEADKTLVAEDLKVFYHNFVEFYEKLVNEDYTLLKEFFDDEERRELYNTLLRTKEEYDKGYAPGRLLSGRRDENGKWILYRYYKSGNQAVPYCVLRDIINLHSTASGDLNDKFEFEHDLTPEEIEEMVFKNLENSRELRQLQYKYRTLLRLQEKVGAYDCEDESGVVDDGRLIGLDVTVQLPGPAMVN